MKLCSSSGIIMTSVYMRKPRNVRSVYARPRPNETEEAPAPGSHGDGKRVCENKSKLNKSRIDETLSSKEKDEKTYEVEESVKQPGESSIDVSYDCSEQKESGGNEKFKTVDGGASLSKRGLDTSLWRKRRREDDDGPWRVGLPLYGDHKKQAKKKTDGKGRGGRPCKRENHVEKEFFVSNKTLNLLKLKLDDTSEMVQEPPECAPEVHGTTVTELKPYVCGTCQRRYASAAGLRDHERTHQKEVADRGGIQFPEGTNEQGPLFTCEVCNKVFGSKATLRKHGQWHRDEKSFVCDICGKGFLYSYYLQAHMRQHTGERPYACDLCDKTYRRNFDLQQHKRTHTGERPYMCNICGKAFMKMDYLKTHRQVHTGLKPFKCDECPLTFRRNGLLKAHKATHTGVRLFECDVCNKKFSTNNVMKKHRLTHLPKNDPVLLSTYQICEICGAKIGRKSSLKTHMMTHTGERPYECEVCSKGYITKNEWLIHRRTHTGERPFVCPICSASYPRNANLAHHISTVHWGCKPYFCDVCNKSFSDRRTLKEHKLIHTGIRPHKCSHCGKCFTQSGSLKAHIRTHTGEKPFACMYCSRTFSDLGGRNRHVRIHTGEKPYKCTQCPAAFARPEPFKLHQETVHGAQLVRGKGGHSNTSRPQIVSSEPVVVVQACREYDGASVHAQDVHMGQVMVVHPVDTYHDLGCSPASDIPSGPTIVVESTDLHNTVSNSPADEHESVEESCVYSSSTSAICEPLPSTGDNSERFSGAEVIEYTIVEHPGISELQLTHEEQNTSGSVTVKPSDDNKEMVPTIIEVQVRRGGTGIPPEVIEVKYDGTVAQCLPVIESQTGHTSDFPASPVNDTDIELAKSGDIKAEVAENEEKIEYVETKSSLEMIESQTGSRAESTTVPANATSQTGSDNDKDLKTVRVIQSETIPCVDDENVLTVTVHNSQDDTRACESMSRLTIVESPMECQDVDSTTTLAIVGPQADSYQVENGTAVTIIESQPGSHCQPNYFQVYHTDETGSVTIIESQAVFEDNSSCSAVDQVNVDHMGNASSPRIIDLHGVESIHIVEGEPAKSDDATDEDDSTDKDEKPLLEPSDQESKYQTSTTVNPSNRRKKNKTVKVEGSLLTDTLFRSKRVFGKAKKDWICEICGKGFTQRVSLKKHMTVQHKIDQDQALSCSVCNRICVSKSELEAHSRSHTGERPFSCELCGNTYKHKADLRQHILAGHMGKKPFTCNVCQKTFTSNRGLKDHKLIHLGIKPHKCSTCGKAFTQSSSLTSHMRIHSGLKPFVCQFCGKGFSEQSSFIRHQRIHTGEKPYRCEHCQSVFARTEQLKSHMSKCHPGDMQNLATLAAVATIS